MIKKRQIFSKAMIGATALLFIGNCSSKNKTDKKEKGKAQPHKSSGLQSSNGKEKGKAQPHKSSGLQSSNGKEKGKAHPHKSSGLQSSNGKEKGKAQPHKSSVLQSSNGKEKGKAHPHKSSGLQSSNGKEKGKAHPHKSSGLQSSNGKEDNSLQEQFLEYFLTAKEIQEAINKLPKKPVYYIYPLKRELDEAGKKLERAFVIQQIHELQTNKLFTGDLGASYIEKLCQDETYIKLRILSMRYTTMENSITFVNQETKAYKVYPKYTQEDKGSLTMQEDKDSLSKRLSNLKDSCKEACAFYYRYVQQQFNKTTPANQVMTFDEWKYSNDSQAFTGEQIDMHLVERHL